MNDLNLFICHDPGPEVICTSLHHPHLHRLHSSNSHSTTTQLFHSTPPPPSTQSFTQCFKLSFMEHHVRKEHRKIKMRKAVGPECISSRFLRSCADQLGGVAAHLLNLSIELMKGPQLWKTSCLVHVPKTFHPRDLNSHRPVALTFHLMKTLEHLILAYLHWVVGPTPVCISTTHWFR